MKFQPSSTMPTVIHHPLTLRKIRDDHYHVEKDGKILGRLYQQPKWENFHAGQWRFWAEGEEPSLWFKSIEEAVESIGA